MNPTSFQKLENLAGYKIPTIDNPFWDELFEPEINNELVELIGVLLGDGGISRKDIVITVHSEAKEYIEKLVIMVKNVFNYDVKFHKRKNKNVINLKIHF